MRNDIAPHALLPFSLSPFLLPPFHPSQIYDGKVGHAEESLDAAGCRLYVYMYVYVWNAAGKGVSVEYAFICTVKYVASVEKSTAKSAKEERREKGRAEEKRSNSKESRKY